MKVHIQIRNIMYSDALDQKRSLKYKVDEIPTPRSTFQFVLAGQSLTQFSSITVDDLLIGFTNYDQLRPTLQLVTVIKHQQCLLFWQMKNTNLISYLKS